MTESLELVGVVYGLGAVIALAAAVLIKAIVAVLGLSVRSAPRPAAVAPCAANPPADGDIPPHHLVAIAAAAHAVIGAHRVVHIGLAGTGAGWSAEGRLAQHGSHNLSSHH